MKTKSKNLEYYPYFLRYDDPHDIPFNRLAAQLRVHPNRLRGMMRSAKHNSSIWEALRAMGYEPPGWFAKPDKGGGAATRSEAGRPAASSAEGRSGAGDRSGAEADTRYIRGHVQGTGAERSSAFSVRSAPRYVLVEPVYPMAGMSPYNEETEKTFEDIRRLHIEEIKAEEKERERERALRRPWTPEQMRAAAEANNMWNGLQLQWMLQQEWLAETTTKLQRDKEIRETMEVFGEIPDRIVQVVAEHRKESKERMNRTVDVMKTMVEMGTPPVPDKDRVLEFIRRFHEAEREKKQQKREFLKGLAKIRAERMSKKNPVLKEIEDRGKRIQEGFIRTLLDM